MRRSRKKGFSLIELIVVIAIMAVLAGILTASFVVVSNNAKRSQLDLMTAEIASKMEELMTESEYYNAGANLVRNLPLKLVGVKCELNNDTIEVSAVGTVNGDGAFAAAGASQTETTLHNFADKAISSVHGLDIRKDAILPGTIIFCIDFSKDRFGLVSVSVTYR